MPLCVACQRPFVDREALHQHLKSSGAAHPFCSICDRRFISDEAHKAHMAARHPPTYPCSICDRTFNAPFALEDHYRGSAAHPNCVKCGRGFFDEEEKAKHHTTAHRLIQCPPCGNVQIYEEDLQEHYRTSQNHPTCKMCNEGVKDAVALDEHIKSAHQDAQCDPGNTDQHFDPVDAVEKLPLMPRKESSTSVSPVLGEYVGRAPLENSLIGLQRLAINERALEWPPKRNHPEYAPAKGSAKQNMAPCVLPQPGNAAEKAWTGTPNVQVSSSFLPRAAVSGPPAIVAAARRSPGTFYASRTSHAPIISPAQIVSPPMPGLPLGPFIGARAPPAAAPQIPPRLRDFASPTRSSGSRLLMTSLRRPLEQNPTSRLHFVQPGDRTRHIAGGRGM
ncbi:Zinc finger and BTB domain-containing protein 16 [Hypsizygus marmoreus]|uniref:Zinc finger and BTB domain-containing protein 16 n=1 Tax=Hypsizygus marmoreus TaxID=39966 RepID=A0A369K7H6_HYPMA|nr:Zinc finger and BTB domain-containing protein 16 [Hypsizygus marmoreus]